MLLLDTNVCIDILRGKRPAIRKHYAAAQNAGLAIGFSVLVRYELEVGVQRSANPTRARALLDAFLVVSNPPLAFEPDDVTAAARIGAALEAKGQSIGPVDILLAGQAVARGADFLTSNLVEFKRVPGLRVAVAERSWIAR